MHWTEVPPARLASLERKVRGLDKAAPGAWGRSTCANKRRPRSSAVRVALEVGFRVPSGDRGLALDRVLLMLPSLLCSVDFRTRGSSPDVLLAITSRTLAHSHCGPSSESTAPTWPRTRRGSAFAVACPAPAIRGARTDLLRAMQRKLHRPDDLPGQHAVPQRAPDHMFGNP